MWLAPRSTDSNFSPLTLKNHPGKKMSGWLQSISTISKKKNSKDTFYWWWTRHSSYWNISQQFHQSPISRIQPGIFVLFFPMCLNLKIEISTNILTTRWCWNDMRSSLFTICFKFQSFNDTSPKYLNSI